MTTHRHSFRAALAVAITAALLASSQSNAAPFDEVARGLVESHGDAVVTLSAVIEVTISVTDRPSQTREQTVEFPGTVFSRDGWIVTSYANTRPRTQLPTPPDGIEIDVASEVKEIRILWADGEESPATIVLNDPDLDVSVIRPNEARESAVTVEFDGGGSVEPLVLDQIVMLARQDESLDRLPLVETGRLKALIERPRRMWIPDTGAPGAPAFHESGKVLGLFLLKPAAGSSPALIVLPADDVARVLREARSDAAAEPAATAPDPNAGRNIAEVGRSVLEEFQEIVISLLAVVERDEKTTETGSVGVVLGEDGLIVTSRTGVGRGDLKEIKIITSDGSEVEGKVVLEDLDLDLAFIQPDPKEVEELDLTFVAAPFGDTPVEMRAADPVIILTRESPAFFRQPRVVITHVDTVIDQPRRYYRTPGKQAGAPAFNAGGKLVGIYARRVTGDETRHRMVLPAARVLEAAERARTAAAKADEPEDSDSPEASDSDSQS